MSLVDQSLCMSWLIQLLNSSCRSSLSHSISNSVLKEDQKEPQEDPQEECPDEDQEAPIPQEKDQTNSKEMKYALRLRFRRRYRRINKILCSLLISNLKGPDHLSDRDLQHMGIDIGNLNLETGEATMPETSHFKPNRMISDVKNGDSEMAKSILEPCEWLHEKSGPGEKPISLPSTLKMCMQLHLEEIGRLNLSRVLSGRDLYGWSTREKANKRYKNMPKFKNDSGKHMYHRTLKYPFKLLSMETVKKARLECNFKSISHNMCKVRLRTACGSDECPSAGELAVVAWQIRETMLSTTKERSTSEEILSKLSFWSSKAECEFPCIAIIIDPSGKARVMSASYTDKLYVHASKLLDFGWIAPDEGAPEVPFAEIFDTEKYLEMMDILLQWMWPLTTRKKEKEKTGKDLG